MSLTTIHAGLERFDAVGWVAKHQVGVTGKKYPLLQYLNLTIFNTCVLNTFTMNIYKAI